MKYKALIILIIATIIAIITFLIIPKTNETEPDSDEHGQINQKIDTPSLTQIFENNWINFSYPKEWVVKNKSGIDCSKRPEVIAECILIKSENGAFIEIKNEQLSNQLKENLITHGNFPITKITNTSSTKILTIEEITLWRQNFFNINHYPVDQRIIQIIFQENEMGSFWKLSNDNGITITYYLPEEYSLEDIKSNEDILLMDSILKRLKFD